MAKDNTNLLLHIKVYLYFSKDRHNISKQSLDCVLATLVAKVVNDFFDIKKHLIKNKH